jgi:hypothetical protein
MGSEPVIRRSNGSPAPGTTKKARRQIRRDDQAVTRCEFELAADSGEHRRDRPRCPDHDVSSRRDARMGQEG